MKTYNVKTVAMFMVIAAAILWGFIGVFIRILSEAEEILEDVWVSLTLAETDEEWKAIRDDTIRKLTELGEPEVFEAYRQQWNAAAAVIVPLVRQAQIANGIEPYTPEQYERYP